MHDPDDVSVVERLVDEKVGRRPDVIRTLRLPRSEATTEFSTRPGADRPLDNAGRVKSDLVSASPRDQYLGYRSYVFPYGRANYAHPQVMV